MQWGAAKEERKPGDKPGDNQGRQLAEGQPGGAARLGGSQVVGRDQHHQTL